MKPEVSFLCSQGLVTGSYPESLILPTSRSFKNNRNIILLLYLRLVPPSGLFRSDFKTKNLYVFIISSMLATCCAYIIFI
jgi:hypothetical protein